MPFSSVLGASSVIKPGVCTSTTRPSVPYDGQMIYETDTNLVKVYEGAAWDTVGPSGVVLTAAQMNAIGMFVTKPLTTFTAVTSVVADNCFSSDYESYQIVIRYSTSATSGLNIALRVGGVNTTTNYNRQDISIASTSSTATRTTGAAAFQNIAASTEGVVASSQIFIGGPALAQPTTLFSLNARNVSNDLLQPVILLSSQNQSASTAFDGFELTVPGGTMTGTITVYGMRQ